MGPRPDRPASECAGGPSHSAPPRRFWPPGRAALSSCARLLCTALLAAPAAAAQQEQTLPAGWLITEANSASSYPFNVPGAHRWQWHYDSEEFLAGGAIEITGLAVRTKSGGGAITFDFDSVEVLMASSPTDYTVLGNGQQPGHDADFDDNLNPDALVVRDAAPWTGTAVPEFSWMPLDLDRPFHYDPRLGEDFIVQIRKCGASNDLWGASIDGPAAGSGLNGGNRYGNLSFCQAQSESTRNDEFVPVVRIQWEFAGPSMQLEPDPLVSADYVTFRFDFVDPGGPIHILWSTAGPGPTSTPLGDLLLSPPITRGSVIHADTDGRLEFDAWLPASFAGQTLHLHAAAMSQGALALSNALALPVL